MEALRCLWFGVSVCCKLCSNIVSRRHVVNCFPKHCLQICFLCGATKGNNGDLTCAFTDISHDAGWWATMGQQVPWTVSPSFSMIRGFQCSMLMPDLLHCWNLGLARDLLGSSLKIIFQGRIIFAEPTLHERMMRATESLKRFAKDHGHPLRCKKFTKGKLIWHNRKYPSLSVSGYDAYVIGLWLEELVSGYTEQYPEISSMLWLSNKAIPWLCILALVHVHGQHCFAAA